MGISKMKLKDNLLRIDIVNDYDDKTLLDMSVVKADFGEHVHACIDGMTTTKKRDEQHRLADAVSVKYYGEMVFIKISPGVLDSGYHQRAQCFLRAYAQKLQEGQDFLDAL